jgi:hypothetical protein
MVELSREAQIKGEVGDFRSQLVLSVQEGLEKERESCVRFVI